jgi:acyl-CoA reductase-like NAD-dependent aldehyde dehydrogenase
MNSMTAPMSPPEFLGQSHIDGSFFSTPNLSGAIITTRNPADGAVALEFRAADAAVVNHAVARSRLAFEDGRWSRMPPMGRRLMLLKFADAIQADVDVIANCDSLDVGKPISSARFEVGVAAAFIRYYAEALDKHFAGQVSPTCSQSMEVQVRRPRGVVLAITPWNYPLINACLKMGPALAAGNCMIIKPSSVSPRSAERLAVLAAQVGLPPGVLQVVQGNHETGSLLAQHPGVDMITFTGSTATGGALMSSVGQSGIKPLLLECGGKNREFVLPDMMGSDLDGIAQQIAFGSFANCGQLCVARSALYVHKDLYEPLLDRIVGVASGMRAGHPQHASTQYGAMSTARQRDLALEFVAAGISEGGQLVCDGRKTSAELPGEGFYLQPCIFEGLDRNSRLNAEEIFGPVLTINRFNSIDEILAIANSGSYGLAATVWTRDIKHANDLASRIEVGKLKVMSTPSQTAGSFLSQSAEPARQSGFGVEGGLKGMESYMRQQVVEYSFG